MRARKAVVVAAVVTAVLAAGRPAHADEVRDAQWHLEALGVTEAYRHGLGAGVTVAVLDSGVDASHPDLRDNVRSGVDLTGGRSDGRDDPGGSGTALAGLIAGHGHGPPQASPAPEPEDTDDGSAPDGTAEARADELPPLAADGVLGLAPQAAILPVVVATPGSAPAPDLLAEGLDEAVRLGADVICLGRPVPDHPAVSRALSAALVAGVPVVAPADASGAALARFGGSGLLSAVPAGPGGEPEAVRVPPGAVAVPASGVTSTGAQGGYFRYARTSNAAASAVLAGAAALVRAAHPDLPGHAVAHRITATAEDGQVDLLAALTAEVDPAPEPSAGPQPQAPEEDTGAGQPGPPDQAAPAADERQWEAAFDSGDWHRWVVAAPLAIFLLVLASVSGAAARRARRADLLPSARARNHDT